MSIQEKIQKLDEESNKLKKLLSKHPDLEEHRGRWHTRLIAKSANPLCTEVEFSHTCGCCSDSPLVVYCSTKDKVYANPPGQYILDRDYGSEYYEPEDWIKLEQTLKNWNISSNLVESILEHARIKVENSRKIKELESQISELEEEKEKLL